MMLHKHLCSVAYCKIELNTSSIDIRHFGFKRVNIKCNAVAYNINYMLVEIPLGRRCRANLPYSFIMVCPAFAPP